MTSCNLENDSSGKCFSGVLRRLFCAGSLQTYPSDNYLSELDKIDFNQPKIEAQTSTTPGVVARLMGLDSMPDTNWVPKQRPTLDSIMRSRSVSSVDFLPPFDLTRHSLHRRVKTSVSFREVPTYLNQKNHDLFVVCIDKVDAVRQNGELGRKNERNFRERNLVKKRENHEIINKSCGREENSKRVDNVTIQKDYDYYRKPNVNKKGKSPLKSMDHKEARDQLKTMKFRKKAGAQCRRVNSVASTSGAKKLITRKKSPAKDELYKNTSPSFVQKGKTDHQERRIHKKVDKPLITCLENNCYSKMSKCILSLTEEDTKGSDWSFVSRKVFKFEDYEEICIQIGDEIFQLLLGKIINQLICEEF